MRFTSIILTLVMLFLVSCAAIPNADAETTTTAAAEIEEIPAVDYGGYKFTFLVSVNATLASLIWNDFHAEEETGDVINDAVFRRNTFIEDKYNIKINDIVREHNEGRERQGTVDLIKKSIAAGDNDYDAVMLGGYGACIAGLEGLLRDLNDMPPIDLTKRYWDQNANRDLMIKGKMFYTTGSISNIANECTYAILFNKKLVEDYELPNLYEIVKNGQWTYEKFIQIASMVSADLNGDSKFDENDLYGALVWGDTMLSVINSIGEKCAYLDKDGQIQLSLYNERAIRSFEMFMDFLFDKTKAFGYQHQIGDWSGTVANNMFTNNQALFYLQTMELVVRLRAMETDFGVLPYPKLDVTQPQYYNPISAWGIGFICVPLVQEDSVRTATILEAMAAESLNTLQPAYYEIALKGKFIRDLESEEMLDLIFSTRIYDLGWLYQIGNYFAEMMYFYYYGNRDFSSMFEKNRPIAEADIETINAAFAGS